MQSRKLLKIGVVMNRPGLAMRGERSVWLVHETRR